MTSDPERTSATGGAARSQASDLDRRAWTPRPGASFAIRTAMVLGPILAAAATVRLAAVFIERPTTGVVFGVWLTALIALSLGASIAAQRLTTRLAPMSFLFKMSLVFPDRAPSRFKTALRSMSGRQLERSVANDTELGSDQAAAEELVVLLGRLSRHDRLTRGHSERVRAYSVMLGEEISLPRDDLDKLNWAALIHDVGKLDVPNGILNKKGRPNDAEWAVLRSHPGAAARYVERLRPWLGDWVDAATQHHERWDGDGYPEGLAGEEISVAGRIVSIADAYDVMTAARSYKAPLPPEQARAELLGNAGTQFDPALVRAFLQISVRRMRWVLGPIGWTSHLPEALQAPAATLASSSTGVLAVGVVSVAAASGVAVAPEPLVAEPFTAERLVAATPDQELPAPEMLVVEIDAPPTTTVPSEPDITEVVESPTTTAPQPTTTEGPPTNTASTTTTTPTTSTTTPTTTTTATAPQQTLTFTLVGGSTAISFSPSSVEVLWATPNPGFDVKIEPEPPGVKVEFESDTHKSRVDAWWDDGPQQRIREEPN